MNKLIAVLLLIPLLGSADPGPATKYLMNEPASLMDIGLLRMRLDLSSTTMPPVTRIIVDENEDKEGISGLSILTQYDYANDMIILRLYLFGKTDEAEQKCRSAVAMFAGPVKRDLGDWFSHTDFKRGNPPSLEDLQSRTSIVCEADFPGLERVTVTRRLDQRTSSVRRD